MDEEGVKFAIIGSAFALLFISTGFIVFLILFYRSRRKNLLLQKEREVSYITQIAEARSEIQQQLFTSIGRDLHDNLGQLLTVLTLQLNALQKQQDSPELIETQETLALSIKEMRALSKSLHSETSNTFDLKRALQAECDRLAKLDHLTLLFECPDAIALNSMDKELVVFRILQEFLNNSLKHSKANQIALIASVNEGVLHFRASDNGIGFDLESANHSMGMKTMKSRAQLVGAAYELNSTFGEGTQLTLSVPIS